MKNVIHLIPFITMTGDFNITAGQSAGKSQGSLISPMLFRIIIQITFNVLFWTSDCTSELMLLAIFRLSISVSLFMPVISVKGMNVSISHS